MVSTIYAACPRGHRYRTGRFSPGLYVRVKGRCPVCRDAQVATGIVTPFLNEIIDVRQPRRLTSITSEVVRRQLAPLSDRPDILRLLREIPRESVNLSVRDVVASMEGWMRHKGSPGGAIPEPNQAVEIIGETNNPRGSLLFLGTLLRESRESPTGFSGAAGTSRTRLWFTEGIFLARESLSHLTTSVRSELQRACTRLGL